MPFVTGMSGLIYLAAALVLNGMFSVYAFEMKSHRARAPADEGVPLLDHLSDVAVRGAARRSLRADDAGLAAHSLSSRLNRQDAADATRAIQRPLRPGAVSTSIMACCCCAPAIATMADRSASTCCSAASCGCRCRPGSAISRSSNACIDEVIEYIPAEPSREGGVAQGVSRRHRPARRTT